MADLESRCKDASDKVAQLARQVGLHTEDMRRWEEERRGLQVERDRLQRWGEEVQREARAAAEEAKARATEDAAKIRRVGWGGGGGEGGGMMGEGEGWDEGGGMGGGEWGGKGCGEWVGSVGGGWAKGTSLLWLRTHRSLQQELDEAVARARHLSEEAGKLRADVAQEVANGTRARQEAERLR